MPMKTGSDIPSNVTLECNWVGKSKLEFVFIDDERTPRIDDLGSLHIVLRPAELHLYEAENIRAEHGWGPFLMDVAMEWVTAHGGWLYPHPIGILPVAKGMWKVYHDDDKRPDVEKRPMTEQEAEMLKIAHVEIELRCCYRKASLVIIDALKGLQKWRDQTPDVQDSHLSPMPESSSS